MRWRSSWRHSAAVLGRWPPGPRRWPVRGRDLADAWGVVLGGVANHAVQCRPQGCRVWVLGLRPAPQPSAVASPSPSAPVQPAAAVRAAWHTPGADHGGTAASTAEPVALPLTEDPPGLFPSQ